MRANSLPQSLPSPSPLPIGFFTAARPFDAVVARLSCINCGRLNVTRSVWNLSRIRCTPVLRADVRRRRDWCFQVSRRRFDPPFGHYRGHGQGHARRKRSLKSKGAHQGETRWHERLCMGDGQVPEARTFPTISLQLSNLSQGTRAPGGIFVLSRGSLSLAQDVACSAVITTIGRIEWAGVPGSFYVLRCVPRRVADGARRPLWL